MGRNIVVLNGGPRTKGNTARLVKAFTEGAESVGCTVREFALVKMDVHECRGCFGGDNTREHPCVQRDGMDEVYPAIRDADVVVLASPLYYWTLSGALRTAVDRLFALEEGGTNQLRGNGRGGVLLMAAEGHGFEDVATYFDHLMEHLRWENLGKVLAGGNNDVGDIDGKPELGQAHALGASMG